MANRRSGDGLDRGTTIAIILESAHGSGAEMRADCLFCAARGNPDHRQSFNINVSTGLYVCQKCGEKGRYGVGRERVVKRRPSAGEAVLPEGFFRLADDRSIVLEEARRYLGSRVPIERWASLGVGACVRGRYAGRIVIPIRNALDALVGFVARAWAKRHPVPYLYSKNFPRATSLFNEAALLEESDQPVFVVEGAFDALHVWRDDAPRPDGVAILGKPSPEQIDKLATCRRPVVVLLDPDADREGLKLLDALRSERLIRSLGTWGRDGRRHDGTAPLPVVPLYLEAGYDPDEWPLADIYRSAQRAIDLA